MTTTIRWLGLALLGILIAAGVSIAASRLASRQIGLASEPISAGDALVPRASPRPSPHGKRAHTKPPRTSVPSRPPPTTTPQPAPVPSPTTPAPPPTNPGSSGGGEGDHTGGADD